MFFFILIVLSKLISTESPNISQTKNIWNTGIAMEADIKPATFRSTFIDIDEYLDPKAVKEGDVIWIQPQCLRKFLKKRLKKINCRFILVVNTCDHSFPDCIDNSKYIKLLLSSDKIMHIFAQNSTLSDHPKVTQIPIGVDFHTLAYGKNAFGEFLTSTKEQEEKLVAVSSKVSARKIKVCSEFHLNDTTKHGGNKLYEVFGETRQDIYNNIKNNTNIEFFETKLPRTDLWMKKAQYAFSICPIGNGMDTHRVWEDLYLGIIPIVKSTPLDPLYRMYPIVIIQDWKEITSENLEKWYADLHPQFLNSEVINRLSQTYWVGLIKDKKALVQKSNTVEKWGNILKSYLFNQEYSK